MFLNKPDIIEMIKKESGNNLFDLVECRIKSEKLYNVYIFTMILDSQDELMNTWEDISSDIAFYFQGGLESEIEIWNIYVLFLVQGSVDGKIRYFVEQNKYSSRKLVIEGVTRPITGEDIESIINEKLFYVRIPSVSSMDDSAETISNTLENNYKKIFKIINHSEEKPSVLFTKYLELVKNEL
ncbi:ABC-three component system middle component 1 [Bacillus thuringiensis]|uniref:ABC-three component system middle component 1 n=1 Tax=Bacillus thuringiensis TaxID=1428 RepID=UPI002FBD72F2